MKNLILFSIILGLVGCSVSMQNVSGEQYSPLIERAKKHISYSAKDPSSIRFRNVAVRKQTNAETIVVCGQVNGKNSFGGNTGFQPFYYYESKGHADSHIVSNYSKGLENSSKNYTYTLWCL